MRKEAPNPIDIHVGNRIRMQRKMLSLSQYKLAKALGVSFQQVQKYEKGINRIGASRLQKIAQILHVPVAFLFESAPELSTTLVPGAANDPPPPSYLFDFLATSDGLALTKAFMRIPDLQLRRRIVELVTHVADVQGD